MDTLLRISPDVDPDRDCREVRIPVSRRLDHFLAGDAFRLPLAKEAGYITVKKRLWEVDGQFVLICETGFSFWKFLAEKAQVNSRDSGVLVYRLPEIRWP
jgi:hypothetical protein